MRKISLPPRFDPRTVQPVARRYVLKVAAKIINKQSKQPTTGCLPIWGLGVGITFVRTNLSCYRALDRSSERIPVITMQVFENTQKKGGGFLSSLATISLSRMVCRIKFLPVNIVTHLVRMQPKVNEPSCTQLQRCCRPEAGNIVGALYHKL